MKQAIVALVRPRLNFSQKESQAAHLLEHCLINPNRLRQIGITDQFYAENIIYHGGETNDFYMAEYSIVKESAASQIADLMQKHQDNLFLSDDYFEIIKNTIIEELLENKGEYIDTGEQLAKAMYTPNSPSVANPWNDVDSIQNLTRREAENIFRTYNTDFSLLNLTFDRFSFDKIPTIIKNKLRDDIREVDLTHPWKSPKSCDCSIAIPLSPDFDKTVGLLYRRSMTDYKFGLLFDKIRNQEGLVYDISMAWDCDNDSFEIVFSTSPQNVEKVRENILNVLEQYPTLISTNIEYIRNRVSLELQLDWGNIQDQAKVLLNQTIIGNLTEAPVVSLERIKTITTDDLCGFNAKILASLTSKAIFAKHLFGKTLSTKKIL